jgi:DivIVA domain-containing protein
VTLTPQLVHEKQFNTVKMRTGYDMDEVDSFLDEVESTLGSLTVENDDLRAQLAQKPSAPVTSSEAEKKLAEAEKKAADAEKKLGEAQAKLAEADKKASEADKKLAEAAEKEKAAETKLTEARRMATANTMAPAAAPAAAAAAAMATPAPAAPAPAPAAAPEPVSPPSSGDVPARALAMLEAAQVTAEQTVTAAKDEADTILAKAREDASKVTGQLDEQRAALETKVNDLRSFERSYRTKLRDTISGQLAELDKVGSVAPEGSSSN